MLQVLISVRDTDNFNKRAVYWLAAEKEARKAARVDPTLKKAVLHNHAAKI